MPEYPFKYRYIRKMKSVEGELVLANPGDGDSKSFNSLILANLPGKQWKTRGYYDPDDQVDYVEADFTEELTSGEETTLNQCYTDWDPNNVDPEE